MLRRILRGVGLALVALLALLVLLAVIPSGTGGLDISAPQPVSGYAGAQAALAQDALRQQSALDPRCATRVVTPGHQADRVVILLHDLGTCPLQFAALSGELQRLGYAVYAPLMPLHGKKTGGSGNLSDLTPEQLRDFADHVVDVADGLGKQVYVVGIGAGGTLAAWIAEQRKEVKGVVAVSPAFGIGQIPGFLSGSAMNLFGRLPNVDLPIGSSLPGSYSNTSSHAAVAVYRIGQSVLEQAELARPVALQVAVLANDADSSIPRGDITSLVQGWRARGAQVRFASMPADLGLPHDLIDERAPNAHIGMVYPIVEQLLAGQTAAPPAVTR
jgi:pimeloyl-ACP methyl ester carboxylesterase